VLLLTTFAVSLLSGLVPVVSVEVYLGGVAAATDAAGSPVLLAALALVAGVGQTVAKVAWYLLAARSMASRRLQRKLSQERWRLAYERWHARISGRPVLTTAVLLASACLGFPPLMIIAVVAGSLRVPLAIYVPTVLVGRTVRFWLLLAGVGWFADAAL
jgi:membrane protein YqaA with SNARE-associated domain